MLSEDKRPEFAKKAGYSYSDLANLTQERRVRLVMGNWFFLGYLATLIAIVSIVPAALSLNKNLAVANEKSGVLTAQNVKLEERLNELDQKRAALIKGRAGYGVQGRSGGVQSPSSPVTLSSKWSSKHWTP